MIINYSKQGKHNKKAGRGFESDVASYLERELKPTYPLFRAKRTPASGGMQLDFEGDVLVWNHPILEQCFLECKLRKTSSALPTWFKEASEAINQKRWIVVIYKKLNERIANSVVSIKKKDLKEMAKEFDISFAINPWKDFYQMTLREFVLSIKLHAQPI